jgi:hypothetical protein
MVAVYLALGLLFLFTDIAGQMFPMNRTPVGIIFIIYGLFRLIVTIQKIRKLNSDEIQGRHQ